MPSENTEPAVTQQKPIEKPKLADLEPIAKTMIEGLKVKYTKGNSTETLNRAGERALRIWRKAATENPTTGKAQLAPFDLSSGVSSLERYFCQSLPEKR